MKLENILSEVTHSQKNTHGKLRISKIKLTHHMELKKKEEQRVNISILLPRKKSYPWRRYGDKACSRH